MYRRNVYADGAVVPRYPESISSALSYYDVMSPYSSIPWFQNVSNNGIIHDPQYQSAQKFSRLNPFTPKKYVADAMSDKNPVLPGESTFLRDNVFAESLLDIIPSIFAE